MLWRAEHRVAVLDALARLHVGHPGFLQAHHMIADLPDPDLVLRTSGEVRISNFLLWQLAYSELYFTDVYWPGLTYFEFLRAVRSYQMRKRRFGK